MERFSESVVKFEVLAELKGDKEETYTVECDDLEFELSKAYANMNTLKLRSEDERHRGRDESQLARSVHSRGRAAGKNMEIPKLGNPENMRLVDFRDWTTRFEDYAAVTRMAFDCNIDARRGILRYAIHEEWTKMWAEGVIQINDGDDIADIIKALEGYLRRKRHPLVDKRVYSTRTTCWRNH